MLAEIAEAAGVAVQTVYNSMGSKAALLMALVDAIDEEADVPSLQADLASATGASEMVRAGVKLTRQFHERCGDIIGALADAAPVDAAAAEALAEGERRHREGTGEIARRLHALGALRDGISREDAAVQFSLLTSRHVYIELVGIRGWSLDKAQAWIERALTTQLLRVDHVTAARNSSNTST